MSVIGINGTASAARIAAISQNDTESVAATRSVSTPSTDGTLKAQEADDKPVTVHFPWLSRLSAQLEAASNKRATFPNQIMGDNVDQKA